MARSREPERLVQMTDEEAVAVVALFRDELARGWIPKLADIEDALETVRRRASAAGSRP